MLELPGTGEIAPTAVVSRLTLQWPPLSASVSSPTTFLLIRSLSTTIRSTETVTMLLNVLFAVTALYQGTPGQMSENDLSEKFTP